MPLKLGVKKQPMDLSKHVLTLPTEKSIPCTDLGDFSLLFYAQEKWGKTALCAEFPDSLFFMFEPGARGLSVYQREIEDWGQFKDYLKLVSSGKRFKTLVMDTADIAYQMCLKWVCKEEGFDHPADEGYGKGWNKVNSEFASTINSMLKTGRGCIFTSHAAEKEIKTRLGEKYDRIVPTMSGGARGICEALVDIWIYGYYDKDNSRWMRVRGTDHVAAGHRLREHFKGIQTIPAGRDDHETYSNLIAAFNNELEIKAEPRKLVLPRKGGA